MPLFRTEQKLVYYAHVPKCGGSAIASYLQDRFGTLGLYDNAFHKKRHEGTNWTRTSPQHVDAAVLRTILPTALVDEMFAVVRHPVPRTVSTFHFQQEVEGRIAEGVSFAEWLRELEASGFGLYDYDNHVLPMNRLVPEGAQVFYLEHGLDALVAWLDHLAGGQTGPRVIMPQNARGALTGVKAAKVVPTPEDVARIGRIYAEDFARFDYRPDEAAPLAPAPEMTSDFLAARARELQRAQRPTVRLLRRLRRRLMRL